MLSKMLELRLPYIKQISTRVEAASRVLGNMLRLNPTQMFSLSQVALFHDIGLIGIPDSILMKQGSLTPEEIKRVNQHTNMGGQFMSRIFPDFPDVEEGVWFHHERPDGRGPHGLTEKEIPAIAGIVATVSAIEAMANDRPHRKAMSLTEIKAELSRQCGVQFPRVVVSAFEHRAEMVYRIVLGQDGSEIEAAGADNKSSSETAAVATPVRA